MDMESKVEAYTPVGDTPILYWTLNMCEEANNTNIHVSYLEIIHWLVTHSRCCACTILQLSLCAIRQFLINPS